jgi:exodeoxyribonuclease-3
LKGKRFKWLPVILLSLLAQFIVLQLLLFIDTFRYFYPEQEGAYTWWSYMGKVRERNIGWRIDYFIASKRLENRLLHATIHPQVLGSDHCPILLELQ